jgi:hypothetical protein
MLAARESQSYFLQHVENLDIFGSLELFPSSLRPPLQTGAYGI